MISAARRGSALPFVRFITSPTNEPIARVRPPRYAATCSGIDATTAAHVASNASPSSPAPTPSPPSPPSPPAPSSPSPPKSSVAISGIGLESPETIAARTDFAILAVMPAPTGDVPTDESPFDFDAATRARSSPTLAAPALSGKPRSGSPPEDPPLCVTPLCLFTAPTSTPVTQLATSCLSTVTVPFEVDHASAASAHASKYATVDLPLDAIANASLGAKPAVFVSLAAAVDGSSGTAALMARNAAGSITTGGKSGSGANL